jgi:hypothetical protein
MQSAPSPAVIKTAGTRRSQLFTVRLTADDLADDEALRICPTIFQDYVPGFATSGGLCCGHRTYAAQIETERLD